MAYYPRSSILELCAFKEAKCYYELSPRYKLDQTDTEKAIEKFQLFVRRYQNAALADSAIALIDMMRQKLAHKEYDAGRLYKRLGQYQAAAIYFGLTMDKYPETTWAEKALSEQVHSFLLLAENSVPDKREERYQSVVETYEKYIQIFPRGPHRSEVETWVDQARVALGELRGASS
jgi:outer membrane protein assembly factor BamD